MEEEVEQKGRREESEIDEEIHLKIKSNEKKQGKQGKQLHRWIYKDAEQRRVSIQY